MVLFLAKSAACIGLVAAVASGVGVDGFTTAFGNGVRAAAVEAEQSCLRSDPCLRAGVGALASAAAPSPAAPRPTKPEHRPAARPAGA